MKFSKLLSTAAVAAAAVFTFGTAQAQTPDGQFGLGVVTGSSSGFTAAYAFTPAFHLGIQLEFASVTRDGNSATGRDAGLYGKFLFSGPTLLRPFVFGRFSSTEISAAGTTTTTGSYFTAGGGAEYFFTRNLGAYGQVGVVNLGFDPSTTTIGIFNAQLGVEYFF